jgi:hypothetical protein
VPIPPFDLAGRIAPGRHVTDVHEVEQRLVMPFPLSISRRSLYSGWRDRRNSIVGVVPEINQEWMAGSFASAKRDPGDIDVVTFLEATDIEALDPAEVATLMDLLTGARAKLRFGTHGFIVTVFEPADPRHDLYLHARGYWDDWWSKDRNGDERGYLDVRGDP